MTTNAERYRSVLKAERLLRTMTPGDEAWFAAQRDAVNARAGYSGGLSHGGGRKQTRRTLWSRPAPIA